MHCLFNQFFSSLNLSLFLPCLYLAVADCDGLWLADCDCTQRRDSTSWDCWPFTPMSRATSGRTSPWGQSKMTMCLFLREVRERVQVAILWSLHIRLAHSTTVQYSTVQAVYRLHPVDISHPLLSIGKNIVLLKTGPPHSPFPPFRLVQPTWEYSYRKELHI